MNELIADRGRVRRALTKRAIGRGHTFLVRKIGRVPLWWQWTEAINIAMVGQIMAELTIARGGLVREWP